jgi:hypothetical protein
MERRLASKRRRRRPSRTHQVGLSANHSSQVASQGWWLSKATYATSSLASPSKVGQACVGALGTPDTHILLPHAFFACAADPFVVKSKSAASPVVG